MRTYIHTCIAVVGVECCVKLILLVLCNVVGDGANYLPFTTQFDDVGEKDYEERGNRT